MKDLIMNPFVQGLLIGLVVVIIVWLNALFKVGSYKREMKKLKEFLNTQMEINAKGNNALSKELEQLKEVNLNLQTTVKTWQTKPSRSELRNLMVYNRALEILFEKERGFTTYWQQAVKEAEAEIDKSDKGVIPLVKKMITGQNYSSEI